MHGKQFLELLFAGQKYELSENPANRWKKLL